MEKREYLLSAKGAYSRYLFRKYKRTIHLEIEGEPLTKKSMRSNIKIDFQNIIIGQLRQQHRRGFTLKTPLCIDMDVFTNDKNPPHIHAIPKNYLDLLSKPLDDKSKRSKIVFTDDMQVKYLNIRYHIGSDFKPSIWIVIYPFNDFVIDIRLAHAIANGDIEDEDQHSRPRCDDIEEKYNDKFIESIEDYNSLIKNKDIYDGVNFEMMKQIYLQSVQENFFVTQTITVKGLYWVFGNGISYKDFISGHRYNNPNMDSVHDYLKDMIVNSPFNIKLPSVPTKDGETEIFKNAIETIMENYSSKNRFLNPLLVPVCIKVFYKPPVTTNNFHKDLDNIMRIIVPIFHDVFKPPVSHLQVLKTDGLSQEAKERHEAALSKIPKSIQHQISGYEIVEVPRVNGDLSDGFVTIVLCEP